jgi:hypothetical protein
MTSQQSCEEFFRLKQNKPVKISDPFFPNLKYKNWVGIILDTTCPEIEFDRFSIK